MPTPGITYDRLLRNRTRSRWTTARLKRTRWSMSLFVWYFGTKGTRRLVARCRPPHDPVGPHYRDLSVTLPHGQAYGRHEPLRPPPDVTDPSAAPPGDDTFYALSRRCRIWGSMHRRSTLGRPRARPCRRRCRRCWRTPDRRASVHLTVVGVFTPETFQSTVTSSPHGAGFLARTADPAIRLVPPAQRRRGTARASTSAAPAPIRARASRASSAQPRSWAS